MSKWLMHKLFNWHYDGSLGRGVHMGKSYWIVHRDTAACACMFCGKMIERPTNLTKRQEL